MRAQSWLRFLSAAVGAAKPYAAQFKPFSSSSLNFSAFGGLIIGFIVRCRKPVFSFVEANHLLAAKEMLEKELDTWKSYFCRLPRIFIGIVASPSECQWRVRIHVRQVPVNTFIDWQTMVAELSFFSKTALTLSVFSHYVLTDIICRAIPLSFGKYGPHSPEGKFVGAKGDISRRVWITLLGTLRRQVSPSDSLNLLWAPGVASTFSRDPEDPSSDSS